jgi:hypothetical protein
LWSTIFGANILISTTRKLPIFENIRSAVSAIAYGSYTCFGLEEMRQSVRISSASDRTKLPSARHQWPTIGKIPLPTKGRRSDDEDGRGKLISTSSLSPKGSMRRRARFISGRGKSQG